MIDFSFLKEITAEQYFFGGLVVIVLFLIRILWKISKLYFNHTTTVIDRNTSAWNKHSKITQRLIDVIEKK